MINTNINPFSIIDMHLDHIFAKIDFPKIDKSQYTSSIKYNLTKKIKKFTIHLLKSMLKILTPEEY